MFHFFKLSLYFLGGHRVSSRTRGVDIFINVCRNIKNGPKTPVHACSDDGKSTSSIPACRIDTKTPIGKITNDTRLVYDNGKIKLVYKKRTSKDCPKGVSTEITFTCRKEFSDVSILYAQKIIAHAMLVIFCDNISYITGPTISFPPRNGFCSLPPNKGPF